MKRIINNLILFMLAAFALVSCKKDMEFKDGGVIPISQLITPENESNLALINTPVANTLFEWKAPAEQIAQSYYVVFYDSKTGGKELFRVATAPFKTSLVISHDDIIPIATSAGIAPEKTGKVYWSVTSFRGESEAVATTPRNELSITRYAAIEEIPINLYLDGTSEKEEDGKLRVFKNMGNGVFEMYAKVGADDAYVLANRNEGGDRRNFFNVVTDGVGVLTEGGSAPSTPLAEGVYRIKADFTKARVTTELISAVQFYHCASGDTGATDMSYVENGVWTWDGDASGDKVIPTGDDRYRFRAIVGGVEEIWGSNVQGGSDAPDSFEGSAYNITIRTRGASDQWDWAFKFIGATQGLPVQSLNLNMVGVSYNHMFDLGNITPEPVESIETPAALSSTTIETPYVLSDNASAKLNFSWTPAASSGEGIAPTYTVIFYNKSAARSADGYNVLNRFSAGSQSSLDITAIQLDELASAAGAKSGGKAELYWSVETKVINKTAISDVSSALFVQRFVVPEELYITGAATEFGATLANAKKMKVIGTVGSGQFELYTKLTAGDYNFVAGNEGDPTKYTISNGKLVIGNGAITAVAGIYRVKVNIVAQSLVLEPVTEVKLSFPGNGDISATLVYSADGAWSTPGGYNATRMGNNGERYRFNAVVNGVNECWGYKRSNNDGPEVFHTALKDQTNGDLPPQYIYILTGVGSDWDYTFKDGRNMQTEHDIRKYEVFMNGDAEYAHPHYHITGVYGPYSAPDATPIDTHCVKISAK